MQNSKLLFTLKLFSRNELQSLDKYLRSPYFFSEKERSKTYPLFTYLLQYSGDWKHFKLQRETVYEYVYGKEKKIKGKLEKLMTKLVNQIYSFISIHFRKDKENSIQNGVTLIQFFRQRKAYSFEAQALKKIRRLQGKCNEKDSDYFLDNFMINQEEIERHLVLDQQFATFELDSALQPLDVFYLKKKLEYACFLLSFRQFIQPIDIENLVAFLDRAKPLYIHAGLIETPLIATYYQAFEVLKGETPNESGYRELKKMIEDNHSYIPFESLKLLNGILRATIVERYNKGDLSVFENLYDLNKCHLELGYLNFQNGILPSTFKNIVTMGLRLKDFDWVRQFLEEYKDKIEVSAYSEDIYHFNLASYFFELKDYDNAQQLLADVYQDLYYKIAAKRLELKIYYETGSEVLDSRLDAFKMYIYRLPKKSLLENKRVSNNNFVDVIRRLRGSKIRGIDKLIGKVKKTTQIMEKNWILEKLEDLKN